MGDAGQRGPQTKTTALLKVTYIMKQRGEVIGSRAQPSSSSCLFSPNPSNLTPEGVPHKGPLEDREFRPFVLEGDVLEGLPPEVLISQP